MDTSKFKNMIIRLFLLVLPVVILTYCQQPDEEIIENNDQVMTIDSDATALLKAIHIKNDDDVQCAQIVYPLGLYVYYADSHNVETVVINSDEELLNFLNTLATTDEISFDFPMSVMTTEGLVTIDSLSEMIDAMIAAMENCFGEKWQYCDANDKKVNVCHNGNTLCISLSALPAHILQGDTLGQCE